MIIIKFNDNIEHTYNNFDEILKLDNYNDIVHINCAYNSLSSLPELPNSLQELDCTHNKLNSLPKLPKLLEKLSYGFNKISSLSELPNSLIYLYCRYNNISVLPELPNSLTHFDCAYNNLSSLPELPNSLIYFVCGYNNISTFPQLPNSLKISYFSNPIHTYIEKYFDGNIKNYIEHKNVANKIGNWFLDCKYNPKYKYCRKRLMKEYKELYN